MKKTIVSSLFLAVTASGVMAGSFGGPPPFTNLSPLQSGIDGSYQATARGSNVTGVIRFAYQNGVQSPIASANNYVFFVNGVVVNGSVTASITGQQLAGVMGGQDFTVPTNTEGGVDLPAVFVVRGNRASGTFNGQIDLTDRQSYFSGSGSMIGSGPERVTFIGISEVTTGLVPPGLQVVDVSVDIPGSEGIVIPGTQEYRDVFDEDGNLIGREAIPGTGTPALIPEQNFKFQGVRTSFTAQGGFTSTSSSQ